MNRNRELSMCGGLAALLLLLIGIGAISVLMPASIRIPVGQTYGIACQHGFLQFREGGFMQLRNQIPMDKRNISLPATPAFRNPIYLKNSPAGVCVSPQFPAVHLSLFPTRYLKASISNGTWSFSTTDGKTIIAIWTGYLIRVWGLPVWSIVIPLSALLTWRLYILRKSIHHEGHCRVCGYDLRATPERCPECGNAQNLRKSSPQAPASHNIERMIAFYGR